MSNRDDRYYTTHRARTPAADQSTVFFQGQGGRTLLPPISSAFPTSSSPVPSHSNPYSQPRSSPNRFEYNQASYNNQWQPNTPMAPHPQPGFGYYEDPRYSAQAYPVYAPRPSTVAPGQHSEHRKLPPLSTTPGPSGREDRWAAPYPTPPSYNGSPPNSHIRSPTASYPASYASAYPAPHAHGHGHGYPVNDPRYVSSLSPQLMANDPRAVSPFGRSHPHASPPTPPPIPIGWDESTATKKRKRADANQLRVPNETYVRIASLSTEECFALVKALDMSPRSVQIWYV
ncbi:hypothetical protein FB45DRAFT_734408 [Roridomyces roridus]|uniref:Homeobox domain-containing protein n=1 Tax=Roridomyces roridus TaxID=1738132 RepID=A0AAD7FYZ2_9AGAR|nr:hypothetical protein FB45DRAFT_734408 [Roridomyces roridus]